MLFIAVLSWTTKNTSKTTEPRGRIFMWWTLSVFGNKPSYGWMNGRVCQRACERRRYWKAQLALEKPSSSLRARPNQLEKLYRSGVGSRARVRKYMYPHTLVFSRDASLISSMLNKWKYLSTQNISTECTYATISFGVFSNLKRSLVWKSR